MDTFFYAFEKPHRDLIGQTYIYEINRFKFVWHRFIEIIVILRGRLEAFVDGRVYKMEEDDILLINSNCNHSTLLKEPGTIALLLHIDPIIFQELYEDCGSLYFACSSAQGDRYALSFCRLRRLMAQLFTCAMDQQPGDVLAVDGYLYLFAAELMKLFPPVSITSQGLVHSAKKQHIIEQIIQYTEENYKKRITLDEIAKLTGYNRSYVSTFFRSCVGISFYEYLTRVRFREATYLLNSTSLSILDIALEAGFADSKSFAAAFRRYSGQSPSQYREQLKGLSAPLLPQFARKYLTIDHELAPEAWRKLREYSGDVLSPRTETSALPTAPERLSILQERLEMMGQELCALAREWKE